MVPPPPPYAASELPEDAMALNLASEAPATEPEARPPLARPPGPRPDEDGDRPPSSRGPAPDGDVDPDDEDAPAPEACGEGRSSDATESERHADPFPLTRDRCQSDECPQHLRRGELVRNVPCLLCFGRASYCCQDCLDMDYVNGHRRACKIQFRSTTRPGKTVMDHRVQQIMSTGFTDLVQHIVENLAGPKLCTNLVLVRLPGDPTAALTRRHPVHLVPRAEVGGRMATTPLFTAVYRRYLERCVLHRAETVPRVYVLVYPPDSLFCYILSFPFGKGVNLRRSKPDTDLIRCPCLLHTGGPPSAPGAQSAPARPGPATDAPDAPDAVVRPDAGLA